MKHCCDYMQMMIDEEKSIVFIPEFREYCVPVRDGGSSFLEMQYCPWCGVSKLKADDKESLDLVFAQLEEKQAMDREKRVHALEKTLDDLERVLDILVLSVEMAK